MKTRKTIVVPPRMAFLRDVAAVCRKHKLSLSHEDPGGAFEVVPFDEEYVDWLMDAIDRTDGRGSGSGSMLAMMYNSVGLSVESSIKRRSQI